MGKIRFKNLAKIRRLKAHRGLVCRREGIIRLIVKRCWHFAVRDKCATCAIVLSIASEIAALPVLVRLRRRALRSKLEDGPLTLLGRGLVLPQVFRSRRLAI